jgi:S1-C subfamily serine protease
MLTTMLVVNNSSQFKAQQKSTLFLNQEIIVQATAITVKIKIAKTSGSGILINKKEQSYTVITNRHVTDRGEKYYIQTPDGYIYEGKLVRVSRSNDLAILEFISEHNYKIATLNQSPLQLGGNLFAVGFPFNSDKLQISYGKLVLQTKKPLKDGYQIGYTNEIKNGMSGGAILNSLGEVVGVNGRSANPIIPDYQFQDGSYPDYSLQQQMVMLSWGIPIKKLSLLLEK